MKITGTLPSSPVKIIQPIGTNRWIDSVLILPSVQLIHVQNISQNHGKAGRTAPKKMTGTPPM